MGVNPLVHSNNDLIQVKQTKAIPKESPNKVVRISNLNICIVKPNFDPTYTRNEHHTLVVGSHANNY